MEPTGVGDRGEAYIAHESGSDAAGHDADEYAEYTESAILRTVFDHGTDKQCDGGDNATDEIAGQVLVVVAGDAADGGCGKRQSDNHNDQSADIGRNTSGDELREQTGGSQKNQDDGSRDDAAGHSVHTFRRANARKSGQTDETGALHHRQLHAEERLNQSGDSAGEEAHLNQERRISKIQAHQRCEQQWEHIKIHAEEMLYSKDYALSNRHFVVDADDKLRFFITHVFSLLPSTEKDRRAGARFVGRRALAFLSFWNDASIVPGCLTVIADLLRKSFKNCKHVNDEIPEKKCPFGREGQMPQQFDPICKWLFYNDYEQRTIGKLQFSFP